MICYIVVDTNILVSSLLTSNQGYLVTGNIKHFPKKSYIVTANQLLDILDNS